MSVVLGLLFSASFKKKKKKASCCHENGTVINHPGTATVVKGHGLGSWLKKNALAAKHLPI